MRLPPFQALLDAHGRDVHRFLIAQVGPVDADDCYQETWLAALRAYPQLRDASNLRSWILTIAHRKAIDHVRSRARRAVPVAEAEAEVEQRPRQRWRWRCAPAAERPTTSCGPRSRRCPTSSARRSRCASWPTPPTPRSAP